MCHPTKKAQLYFSYSWPTGSPSLSARRNGKCLWWLFFLSSFLPSNPSSCSIEQCASKVPSWVNSEMKQALLSSFTKEEVKEVLFQLAPLKSLGPVGFSACFYQSCWHVVGEEVCTTVLSFLNDFVFDDHINSTYIVLIPKISNPTRHSDFRPINLCNIIYKLVSKVLANRMKQILHILFLQVRVLLYWIA